MGDYAVFLHAESVCFFVMMVVMSSFYICSILILADPNSMWHLLTTSFVILNILCSSFGSLLIMATSSINSRDPIGYFA